MARTLRIDGTFGNMSIASSKAISESAAIDPTPYLTDLYFHSDLAYAQLPTRASASTLTFSGVTRNYTSWNESDKKGGCFITTAAVKYNQETDDGDTLNTLRQFRDSFMSTKPHLQDLVKQYYDIAPALVEKLEASPNAQQIFNILYNQYILPAKQKIKAGDNDAALLLYLGLVRQATIFAEQP